MTDTTELQPTNVAENTPTGSTNTTATEDEPVITEDEPVIALKRRNVDRALIAIGAVLAVVLVVSGGLLTWGATFSNDYVDDELSSQHVVFPAADRLEEEGRTDLVKYADETVNTGPEAEAYASYINGHLQGMADGATYADLGTPEREARAAVEAAKTDGASEAEVAALEADAAAITGQRDTMFKGETLRGLLLTAFAWSTIGRIAGIAAIAAFIAAAVLALLVLFGIVHLRRTHHG